ncbi:MAG: hypothetical protein V4719_31420 [Planctomycetota bacterium]
MCWTSRDLLNFSSAQRLLRLGIVCCALFGFVESPVWAQVSSPASELVEELRLPLDKITPDLLPDRVPVPLSDYQALKTLVEATREGPSKTRLLKAEYSAVYKDHRLADGQLTWSFENTSGVARTSVVEPLGMAVRELQWGDKPAVWGASRAGRFEVLLDRPVGQLTGRWELTGKTVGQHDEFVLSLPRSIVSQLTLKVPSGAMVTAQGHSVAAGAAQDGITPWTIVVAPNAECRVVIHQPQTAGAATPLILVQHDALYLLRQEGLRFRTNLRLEVTQAAVREIPIWVDPELEIFSITYGNEIPLPWQTTAVDGRQRLLVQLPDALLGAGRVLKLSGVSPLKTDVDWKLPNVVVAGSALVEGQTVLQLTPPLQLQDLSTTGFRQIGAETTPSRDDVLTFKQFRADGVLSVKLGKPRPRILARVLSDLQTKSPDWTCATQLQLTGAEGSAFSVECRIPAGWDVIDVRDPNAPKLEWNIAITPEGQRLLTLQFLEALTPDKPRTIEIDARRSAATGDQIFAVPAFEPLNVDDLRMLVAVNSATDVRPVLESGTSFEPCEPSDLDAEWLDTKFWKTPLTERSPAPLLLRLNGNTAEGHFSLQSLQTPVEVSAEMQVEVTAEKLTKTVRLKVVPRHGKTERVLVYQSEPGPQLAWTLIGMTPKLIEARKLPVFRHAAWDLPTSGELWELRLPQPQSTPFELEGVRARGLTPTGRLGLVFVPQAQAFHGRVSVKAPIDLGLELTAWHTEADGIANAAAPMERVWTWHLPTAALQYQTRVATALAPAPVIRRVAIQARWNLEPKSYDYYVAQLELGSGFTSRQLRCILPETAELTDVEVDGQPLQFPPPARGLPIVLTNVTDEQVVSILYRAPSQGLLHPTWRSILMPKLEIPVLRCDLELLTPAGFRLGTDPRGMVLKSNAVHVSTLQRVFGPLGRSGQELLFNPFSGRTWSQLWSNTHEPESNPQEVTEGWPQTPLARDVADVKNPSSVELDSLGAPLQTGWQVWRGSAAMLPERVELWLWSNRQATSAAWLGFWGCLLLWTTLRLARVPYHAGLGILALVGEIILTFILPPLPAQLVGGCLAGTLLSFLWPRKLICRSAPPTEKLPHIPQGSTHSYRPNLPKLMSSLTLFVAFGLCGGLAWAQPTVPGNGNGLPRVIIPVDGQNRPLGQPPLAYLPERLLKDWTALQSAQQLRAPWLLRSGEYILRRDAGQQISLTARYDVTVLSDAAEVEVQIPLTGVNFGGDTACLVDGQPHSVLLRPDANALVLRLPGVIPQPAPPPMPVNADQALATTVYPVTTRSFRVEFQGFPVLQSVADRQWMEFNLPRLQASSWILQNDHPDLPWTIKTGETIYTVAPKNSWPRELGPITRLRIEPSATAATTSVKPALEARLVLLADVQPAVSQLHYQASYRVMQGQVSNVFWQLPAGLAVREVSGPEVFDWHLIPIAGGASRLQVDLRSPVSEGFSVKVEALLPNEGPPSQLTIPPVLLLTPGQDPLRPALSLTAIRTTSEFQPEVSADAGSQIATATVDHFLKEWGSNGVDQKPQLAFTLLDPAPLKIGLRSLLPQRVVRMTTIGVLGSRRLQWSVNATIEVQTAAAYAHQIEIDPRLTVTNVNIQEDAANRLLRWTRTGNVLHVFLRDKTTGTQTLSLQGTMPTQVPQEMALPTIKFLNATVVDAKLQLYQEPDLEVELADPGKWERLEVPSELRLGAARNLLVGRFKWNPEAGPFVVRAAQNEPVLNYSAVTSLQPRDGRWKLTTNLLFEVLQGHGSQFSIRVPPELPLVRVDAADVRQLLEREADGGQRIVLIPQAPVRGRFVVQVSGEVNLPAGGLVTIPEVQGLNATRKDHFLVLPSEGQLTVDSRTSGLISESLPADLAKLLPADLQGTSRLEYRGNPGAWTVTVPRRQEDIPLTGVLWSETQIWCGPADEVSGRTTILLGPQEIEQIDLNIPVGNELQGVLLDGEFIPHAAPREHRLRIPLTFPQAGHVITLYWTQETTSFKQFSNQAEFHWPHVAGKKVREEFVTLTPPAGFRVRSREGKSVERIQVQLSELQTMLELMHQRTAGGPAPQDSQWLYLHRQVGSLIKRLQMEPQLKNRKGSLSEQFSKLRTQFAPWEQSTVPLEASAVPGGLSPAMLRSFSSLEGNLAGPHSLLVRLGTDASGSQLKVSLIHESLWSIALGLGLAIVVLILVWPLLRWQFPEWLAEQPAVAWLILGLIWWPCLTPSWLGLVWLSLAAFYGLRHLWRTTSLDLEASEVDNDPSQPALQT